MCEDLTPCTGKGFETYQKILKLILWNIYYQRNNFSLPGVKGWEVGSSLDWQSGRGTSLRSLRALPAALCLAAWAVWPSPTNSLLPTLNFTQKIWGNPPVKVKFIVYAVIKLKLVKLTLPDLWLELNWPPLFMLPLLLPLPPLPWILEKPWRLPDELPFSRNM